MAFHFLLFFALLNLAFGGSQATLTKEELHWISVFPRTPMPKVLQDILPQPGRSTLFRGHIDSEQKGVNDSEFADYTYQYDSRKEFKSKNAPINKGVKDPEFANYTYQYDSGKEFKSEDILMNKGVNDPEFADYTYQYDSGKESKSEDAPINNGVNDSEFADYTYQYDSNKESKSEYAPINKGVNDPEFADYTYQYDLGKESQSEDAPINKGVNDPEFADYTYQYDSRKESQSEDAPINKGINDPEFADYTYQYNSDKKFKSEDAPINKSVNYSDFADYTYQYNSDKESKSEVSRTERSVNDPESPEDKYNSAVDNAPNKKGNRKTLEGNSKHDTAAIKETIYFFQKDLLPGTKVNLPRLVQKRNRATFLPQQVAELTPFSNDKLPEILKSFSLKAESSGANSVKVTVKNCERAGMKGEERYCATSFESFIDLSVSMLGKNIQLLSHELGEETKNPLFTIGKGVQNMGENDIVCHKMKYPYAVYLCHSIEKTEVYKVPLVGLDGTKAKAVAVCHKDTSAWSPNHIAFRILKVKPGTVPICHFLGIDTLVWIPN